MIFLELKCLLSKLIWLARSSFFNIEDIEKKKKQNKSRTHTLLGNLSGSNTIHLFSETFIANPNASS